MRWLSLLVASVVIAASGQALALPNADAEQAYANGDYRTAFMLWLPLAEQGSPRAQMNVARMYEKGQYVAQDSAVAAEWYHKAADQNQRDAANSQTMAQAVVPQQSTAVQPQPVYYPVVRRVPPPIFVPIHRHWRH
jgi:TPR repeat protein